MAKYDNVNPFAKLHPGEPWFFIRAQDTLASEAVQAYADLLKRESDKARAKGEEELAYRLFKQALDVLKLTAIILDWQLDHKKFVKLPD